jgi:MFS family permease
MPMLEILTRPFTSDSADPFEARVIAKVSLRLIPFLFLLYVINILDRANVNMTRLQMVDLGILDETVYALGAGIFYVGYVLFEVPSNLILARVGARAWIARILVSWGLVSVAMMFVTGPWSFIILRILLGVAEAGFFPGIILYLSQWFPARVRARAISRFMIAALVAGIIGSPVSGFILEYMNGTLGLAGWQWVFLLEGLPAVFLGGVTLFVLTDRPAEAKWLTDEERDWLVHRMDTEEKVRVGHRGSDLRQALRDPRVWLLVGVYFTVALGDNGFGFYSGKLLSDVFPTWTESQIGLLVAVPFMVAMAFMLWFSAHSDRTNERRWHVATAAFIAAVGWSAAAFSRIPWFSVAALCVALLGMKSMLPVFWALPTNFLGGRAAAGGIALINSIANIGGFLAPILLGQMKVATGSFAGGMLILAVTLFGGGLLVLQIPPSQAEEKATATPDPALAAQVD